MATPPALVRLGHALTAWPRARSWVQTLAVTTGFSALALLLGASRGLLEPQLTTAPILPLLLRTLVFPSLTEELLFRVLPPPRYALPALVLYALYHPLNAWLFFPSARSVFYDSTFLTLTALLGGCCTLLYRHTGSVWPSVLLHWSVVFFGVAFFGLMPAR